MLAAENWCLKVDEKVYGPYTTSQMRKFAHEGRLASWSLISPAGSREWREARKEGVFADFFGCKRDSKKDPSARPFGKREYEETASEHEIEPQIKLRAKHAHNDDIGVANFIIIFDVVSGAASRVEAAVTSLGNGFRVADNVWNVTCELTAVGVRNAIAPYLSGRESLFVIDATRGRTSWQNYVPELHAKISASYLAPKAQKTANAH